MKEPTYINNPETELRHQIVGNYRHPTALPNECKRCHNARWGSTLINGICAECLFRQLELNQEEIQNLKKRLNLFFDERDGLLRRIRIKEESATYWYRKVIELKEQKNDKTS